MGSSTWVEKIISLLITILALFMHSDILLRLMCAPTGLGNRTAWVAWSGGMSRAQGIIEVPSGFAACLGLQRGMRVNLALPPPSGPGAVVEAESVVVEPVSWSDWEVLELNAGHLEEVIMNQASLHEALVDQNVGL